MTSLSAELRSEPFGGIRSNLESWKSFTLFWHTVRGQQTSRRTGKRQLVCLLNWNVSTNRYLGCCLSSPTCLLTHSWFPCPTTPHHTPPPAIRTSGACRCGGGKKNRQGQSDLAQGSKVNSLGPEKCPHVSFRWLTDFKIFVSLQYFFHSLKFNHSDSFTNINGLKRAFGK